MPYLSNGKIEYLTAGVFFRLVITGQISRNRKAARHVTELFDGWNIGDFERENQVNVKVIRDFICETISLRKKELAAEIGSDRIRTDFLSMMLQDELFMNEDSYLVDECITFLIASTQTTTSLITNTIYYLTRH